MGGHTVEDPEIKYGLAVTGLIHPDKILSNAKANPGDQLVLTKPLGTGIISTALKGGMASEEAIQKMVESMVTLNQKASEWMQALGAHACTDITGFGFIGHALEMARPAGWAWSFDRSHSDPSRGPRIRQTWGSSRAGPIRIGSSSPARSSWIQPFPSF